MKNINSVDKCINNSIEGILILHYVAAKAVEMEENYETIYMCVSGTGL